MTSKNTTRLLQYHALPPPLTLRPVADAAQKCKGESEQDDVHKCEGESERDDVQKCEGASEQDDVQTCNEASTPESPVPHEAGSDAHCVVRSSGDGVDERNAVSDEDQGGGANSYLVVGAQDHYNDDGIGALQSKDDDREENAREEHGNDTAAERKGVDDHYHDREERSEEDGDHTRGGQSDADHDHNREESESEEDDDHTTEREGVLDHDGEESESEADGDCTTEG